MALQFNRRFGLAPGLRLNLGKRGVSVSVGEKGAWLTAGTKGVRTSLGVPGTGVYWTEQARWPARVSPAGGAVTLIARGLAWLVGVAIGLAILAMIASYGG